MTAKTGRYYGDQLFHPISCDNDPTKVYFMYFPHHKVKATHFLNGLSSNISEELFIKPNDFITRSVIDRSTMGIGDKEKRTFADPNELHNEEAMEVIFEDTGIAALYLDQNPQAVLKKKMKNLYEADLQKSYAQAQGKDDETVTIASISRQIVRKIKAWTKIDPPLGFNIAPAEYPSIT